MLLIYEILYSYIFKLIPPFRCVAVIKYLVYTKKKILSYKEFFFFFTQRFTVHTSLLNNKSYSIGKSINCACDIILAMSPFIFN